MLLMRARRAPPLVAPTGAYLATRGVSPGTVAGLVDSWADARGRLATATGTARPTYQSSPRPMLRFDASNDVIEFPGTLADYVSTGAGLVVIAGRSVANSRYFLSDTNNAMFVYAGTNGAAALDLNSSAQSVSRPAGLGLPYVLAAWWDGTNARIMVNGGTPAAVASSGPSNLAGTVFSDPRSADLYGVLMSAAAADATEARARAASAWLAAQLGLSLEASPPPGVSGLAGWLDARTLLEATTADAATVATVLDGSGLNRTGTGNASPTYRAAAINGRPAVRCGAATNQRVGQNGVAATFSGSDVAVTVFLVGQLRSRLTNGLLWTAGNNTTTAYMTLRESSGKWRVERRGDSGIDIGVSTAIDTDLLPHVFETVFAGTSVDLLIDGVVRASGVLDTVAMTVNNFCWSDGLIASAGSGAGVAPLDFGAGLVYAGALSAGDRAAIRAQLGRAFGIAVA